MYGKFLNEDFDSVNHGQCTRKKCDISLIREDSKNSIGPMLYWEDVARNDNCNKCLTYGADTPRTNVGPNSFGVSTFSSQGRYNRDPGFADLENKLTGRHASQQGLKRGRFTNMDIRKYSKNLTHKNNCSRLLSTTTTKLENPSKGSRELTVNRFIDFNLPLELTTARFGFGSLTQMQAKDDHVERNPYMVGDKFCLSNGKCMK